MKSLAKTMSWAVVSFFLILSIELATHAIQHGTVGLDGFARTAGLGVLIACILKTPVYFVHELAWDRKAACGTCKLPACVCRAVNGHGVGTTGGAAGGSGGGDTGGREMASYELTDDQVRTLRTLLTDADECAREGLADIADFEEGGENSEEYRENLRYIEELAVVKDALPAPDGRDNETEQNEMLAAWLVAAQSGPLAVVRG